MKYIVVELQKDEDGAVASLITAHDSLSEAESKYFSVLSFAAVSSIPKHSAALLDEDGYLHMSKSYDHTISTQPEEVTADEG